VATDEALRRELGARGRARAGLFTWTRTARATMDAYLSCLAAAAPRRRRSVARRV